MLRRIRIRDYKSLRDVEVDLQPLSVLFGPNAGGKSNFLDALQLLSRIASSRSLKEAFDPPYRGTPLESFSIGRGGIEELLDRDSAAFRIEADIELSNDSIERVEKEVREFRSGGGPRRDRPRNSTVRDRFVRERRLRYGIEIEIVPRSGILRLKDESLTALRQDGKVKRSRNPFLERVNGHLHLRMEKQSHPKQIEAGIDHAIISRSLYPPHCPHLLAVKYELQNWSFFYFEPRERMRAPNAVREVRHIGLMGEDLAAFLNTLMATNARQFHAVEKGLRQFVRGVSGLDVAINKFGEVELSVLEGDARTPIPSRLLSEGTLRVIGLLAASSSIEHPGLIGLEQPENGVYPRRIELVAEYLLARTRVGRSQFVVTSHSPVLLDLIPAENLFVCQQNDRSTAVSALSSWESPYRRGHAVAEKANDQEAGTDVLSLRLLRGEFDDC